MQLQRISVVLLMTGSVLMLAGCGKKDFKAEIEKQAKQELLSYQCEDYDGDGKEEAFAFAGKYSEEDGSYSGELYFANQKGAFSVEKSQGTYFNFGKETITAGDRIFICMEEYYVTGSKSILFGLENGKPARIEITPNGGSIYQLQDNEYRMTCDAYDLNLDETGHTWKYYYFYWDGKQFREHGAKEISKEELLKYKNAEEILKEIDKEGYQVRNILYRENDIIHINIFNDETNENVNLQVKDNSLEYINEMKDVENSILNLSFGGIYKIASNEAIATFPEGSK